MATLDDSPSLFSGQSWSLWAENVNEDRTKKVCANATAGEDNRVDSMKLNKNDMSLYGLCPARDEFYLAVCDQCGQVVKPQALQSHIEQRHKGIGPREKSSPQKYQHSAVQSKSSYSQQDSRAPGRSSSRSTSKQPESGRSASDTSSAHVLHRHSHRTKDSSSVGSNRRSHKHDKSAKDKSKAENHVFPRVTVERIGPDVIKKVSVQDTSSYSPEGSLNTIAVKEEAIDRDTASSRGSEVVTQESHVIDVKPFTSDAQKKEMNTEKVRRILATVVEEPWRSSPPSVALSCAASTIPVTSIIVATTAFSTTVSTVPVVNTMSVTSSQKFSNRKSPPVSTALSFSAGDIDSHSDQSTSSSAESLPATTSKSHSVGSAEPSAKRAKLQVSVSGAASSKGVHSSSSSPISAAFPADQNKKHQKDKKNIPCKDREFEVDRHCGVWIEDQARRCTRSLTCKTHALSLRRKVPGRSKPFDELLRELRANNEATKKEKAAAAAATQSPSMANNSNPLSHVRSPTTSGTAATTTASSTSTGSHPSRRHSTDTSGTVHKVPQISPFTANATASSSSGNSNATTTTRTTAAASSQLLTSPLATRPSVAPIFPKNEPVAISESLTYQSSDGEDEDDSVDCADLPYLSHHPRPAVMNSFGGWQHGSGCYVFNRKADLYRAAFMAAVDKHLHPPPHKRLCLESKLPRGSCVGGDSKDPYEFTLGESNALGSSHKGSHSAHAATGSHSKNTKTKMPPSASLGSKSSKGSLKESNSVLHSTLSSPGLGCSGQTGLTSTLVARTPSAVIHHGAPPRVTSSQSAGLAAAINSKRKRQGSVSALYQSRQSSSQSGGGVTQTTTASPASNAPAASAVLSASVSGGAGNQAVPISITIPAGSINFNLNSQPLSGVGGTVAPNKPQPVLTKANLLKDLNIVVTNIDGSSVINGQLVSLPSGSLGDVPTVQLSSSTEESVKRATQAHPAGPRLAVASQGGLATVITRSVPTRPIVLEPVSEASGAVAAMVTTVSDNGASTPHPSPAPSPRLLSDAASPVVTSLPNGLMASTHGITLQPHSNPNHLGSGAQVVTPINLSGGQLAGLTEQILSQSGPTFTLTPGKADTIQEFPKSSTLTPAKAMLPTQVAPTPATAQKLAAAALELTTQSSCLLTANNMQQLYTGHVLSQSVRTGGATSYTPTLQFHTKGGLTAGTKGMPVQPMSLTIVAPGAGVGLPQQPPLVQQTDPTHVVLQTDDISVVSEDTNSHPNILS